MSSEKNTRRQNSWMILLNDYFEDSPLIKDQLELSELIDTERGCEIRIPINQRQDHMVKDGSMMGLYRNLIKIKSTLSEYRDKYPGFEEITFSLKMTDGSILSILDQDLNKYISDFQEEAISEALNDKIEIDCDLPDDAYTKRANSFAEALYSNDYAAVEKLITDDVRLIRYDKETLNGKDSFVDYWRRQTESIHSENSVSYYHIKYNPFINRAIISIRQRNNNRISSDEVYVFLYLREDLISLAVITPRQQQPIAVRYYDFDTPALAYDVIMKDKEESLPPKPNRMPCLHCGRQSEELHWYKLYVNSGPYGHIGHVSVCPYCRMQAEFYPEIFLRQS